MSSPTGREYAPERFAAWLASYRKTDKFGHVYAYHPRSDAHSIELSALILEDLVERCPTIRDQAERGEVACGINVEHVWPHSKKKKTIDLALGRPTALDPRPTRATVIPQVIPKGPKKNTPKEKHVWGFSDVYFSCEAKSVMTEHGKAQPRVFDELSSSHEIVHKGRPDAIAAGIAVVNIAGSFVSPTRKENQSRRKRLAVTQHRQPDVTSNMVAHLRGLAIRETIEDAGFDAYCTMVVECDNQTGASLWTAPPAPQPGDRDHYETFLARLVRFYSERFSNLP